jgi:hypothetical protein
MGKKAGFLGLGTLFMILTVFGCSAPYSDYYAAKQVYETKAPMIQALSPERYTLYRNLFMEMQKEMDSKNWRRAKKLARKIQEFDTGLPQVNAE